MSQYAQQERHLLDNKIQWPQKIKGLDILKAGTIIIIAIINAIVITYQAMH